MLARKITAERIGYRSFLTGSTISDKVNKRKFFLQHKIVFTSTSMTTQNSGFTIDFLLHTRRLET